jgi:hypothetical protein
MAERLKLSDLEEWKRKATLYDALMASPEPPTCKESLQVAELLAILEKIEADTRTFGGDWGVPHVAELARQAMAIVRGAK